MHIYKTILLLIVLFSHSQETKELDYFEAFTHPTDRVNSVSIYSQPNIYLRELMPDSEGGWIVKIKDKKDNYFKIEIEEVGVKDVWIHKGDLGVIIQNYDFKNIPFFESPNNQSRIKLYLKESYIALLYDKQNEFYFVQITIDKNVFYGWVESKYICSNPYTTCG